MAVSNPMPAAVAALIRPIEEASGRSLPSALLSPLADTVARWQLPPAPRRPTLGNAGVLVSARLTSRGVGGPRVDVEPLWDLADPRAVHDMVRELSRALGRSGHSEIATPLRIAAWPPPGIGPGPYLGISAENAAPSARVWGPATPPRRPLAELVHAVGAQVAMPPLRSTPLFAGIEADRAGLVKLSIYAKEPPEGALASAAAPLIAAAQASDPDAYVGTAWRCGARGSQWRPVAEINMFGAGSEPACGWLRSIGWTRAADMLAQLGNVGFHLWMVTLAVDAVGHPEWVTVYGTPSASGLVSGRSVRVPAIEGPVNTPDRPGATAQSVIDWRGMVHTASWEGDGTSLRWRTEATRDSDRPANGRSPDSRER